MKHARHSPAGPILLALLALPGLAPPVRAEIPVIEAIRATPQGAQWRFDVTLKHPDTGWDHYADAWEVLDADGQSLGLRVLVHPHVDEQPFTRSLGGVAFPAGTQAVFVRARCIVDGWGAVQEFALPE